MLEVHSFFDEAFTVTSRSKTIATLRLCVLESRMTMPLVSRFFAEMSKKHQRCAVVDLENNFSISAQFTVIVSNNYPRINSEMDFTIEGINY
jgi:hypothetical protein